MRSLTTLSHSSILAAFWVETLYENWENNKKIFSEKECILGRPKKIDFVN